VNNNRNDSDHAELNTSSNNNKKKKKYIKRRRKKNKEVRYMALSKFIKISI
jgi:hypothetical protein